MVADESIQFSEAVTAVVFTALSMVKGIYHASFDVCAQMPVAVVTLPLL